jgi:hypothetical protein
MPDDQVDQDLEHMAGSSALGRHLKESLTRLKNGAAGPALAEMAREVLEGRTTLGQVAASSAYAGPLTAAADEIHHWNATLTDKEREELIRDAKRRLGEDDADK